MVFVKGIKKLMMEWISHESELKKNDLMTIHRRHLRLLRPGQLVASVLP